MTAVYTQEADTRVRSVVESATNGLFVDGVWRPASDGGTFTDVNPANESVIGEVAAATVADVDAAVASARRALDGEWGAMPGVARAALLHRLAELIDRDADVLAALEATDIGRPIAQPTMLDLPMAAGTYRHFAGWADKINGESVPTAGYFGRPTHSYTVREPVGVIAAIIPWNTPLMISAWKLAPALAAGNTVVIKPPEDAPLSLLHLGRLIAEAGFPAGVVNIVPGLGEIAGDALSRHPGVDKVSFTGSPEVGRLVQRNAADTFKRVTLELGGKSPQIILPDADLDAAIAGTAMGLFFNQGQVCAAGTRILVHRSVYGDVLDGLAAAAAGHVLGDPFDPATTMGPLVNAAQRERVQRFVATGRAEGARVVAGGEPLDRAGYFVAPTVFADATNEHTIARQEIFGPVGTVIAFDSAEEALRLANDTDYGLAATVWTRDISTALTLAGKVRAGSVGINGWSPLDPALPWGGMKTSGIGRELGWSGILANTEEKVVTVVL